MPGDPHPRPGREGKEGASQNERNNVLALDALEVFDEDEEIPTHHFLAD